MLTKTTEEVLRGVLREREYQKTKWSAAHDASNSDADWLSYILGYLAPVVYPRATTPGQCTRDEARIAAAAIIVAWLEQG